MTVLSRRAALGFLLAGAPAAALAARRRAYEAAPVGPLVDVSPLRRYGDNTDADFLAEMLPGYLRQIFGPGHSVRVRIDSATYGAPGSNGSINNNGAVDTIEGVGWVDGREIPVQSSIQTAVYFPDVGGYAARTRQLLLGQSFAQWLARESGAAWR
jgi:hypothetical protein